MKGPAELRKIINRLRSRQAAKGVRNGKVGWADSPRLDRLGWGLKRKLELYPPNTEDKT